VGQRCKQNSFLIFHFFVQKIKINTTDGYRRRLTVNAAKLRGNLSSIQVIQIDAQVCIVSRDSWCGSTTLKRWIKLLEMFLSETVNWEKSTKNRARELRSER
jgi:hypothetical protein